MYIFAFLGGTAASMGLGGGMIMLAATAAFTDLTQQQAQGLNLIFFIPIAAVSVLIYSKRKLIEWKKILPSLIWGAAFAVPGCLIARYTDAALLRKGFALFLLVIGIKELFFSSKARDVDKSA